MFRFVQTADWQIGMMAPGLGEAAETARAARLESLAAVLDLASARQADAILVCGDQFEHNQVAPALVERVLELLDNRTRVPIYLIPGNHDPFDHGSVYHRPAWGQLRDHVHLLTRPEALELDDQVTLFACPIVSKFGLDDPTAWIPPRGPTAKADRRLRIGLAHGTMRLSEIVRGDEFPIPVDAAQRRGLDYLALGHVHATIPAPQLRAGYCGAHETTRFGEGDSGNALVVTLEPGVPPRIETVRTGVLGWRDHVIDLDRQSLDDAARELRQIPDAERTLLRVMLKGGARPDHRAAMAGLLLPLLQARFLYHRLDDSQLRPPSFDETFAGALGAPHLQQAAERLRAIAEQRPDDEVLDDDDDAVAGPGSAADDGDRGTGQQAAAFAGVSRPDAARRALEILQEVAWSQRGSDGS